MILNSHLLLFFFRSYFFRLFFFFLVSSVGVHCIQVALLTNKADITYKPSQTSPESLVNDIHQLGFGAEVINEGAGPENGYVDLEVLYRLLGIHV